MHGYVNYGTEMQTSDVLPEASEVLVFLLNAVNAHWKIPIGYFLMNGLNGSERVNLITQCLRLLHDNDVEVISLTFDGAAANLAMANQVGACITSDVAFLKPYFIHTETKKYVWVSRCLSYAKINKKCLWHLKRIIL